MKERKLANIALRASLIYAAAGALWILLSDRVLAALLPEAPRLAVAQTYKGWIFVAATSVLLYAALRGPLGRWEREVLARRRAEEALAASERRLAAAQKLESLGVLAGGIAHDFNNLFMAIQGNVELALTEMDPRSGTVELLEEARLATRKAAELARTMLAYSGRGQFVMERLDLASCAGTHAQVFRAGLPPNVELALDLPTERVWVMADPSQVEHVVRNLLANALEAMGQRTGTIHLSVSARMYTEAELETSRIPERAAAGRYVCLAVRDDGGGMDAATVERLFDPFFTTKFAGRGLGMPAVLGIVRGHRGAIHVDSAVGGGTTVRVLLPEAAAGGNEAGGPAPGPAVASSSLDAGASTPAVSGRGLILVVDDERDVRALCLRLVEHLGYRGVAAADGEEALQIYRARGAEIACVILDLTMPRLDGVGTLRELRRIDPGVRAILSSGYAQPEATAPFLGLEIRGFIQKPYRLAELEAAIARALAPASAT